MARVCTICAHQARATIETALVDGASLRDIAGRFGVSRSAVERHKRDHLARELASPGSTQPVPVRPVSVPEYAAQRVHGTLDVFAHLDELLSTARKLLTACDVWLRDPDHPDRYSVDPRADTVQVVYLDYNDPTPAGEPRRKRQMLQALVDQVMGASNAQAVEVTLRQPHPAELLLKSGDSIRGQLELATRIAEALHNAQESERFRVAVLDAIAEAAPDVRAAIIDSLQRRRALG